MRVKPALIVALWACAACSGSNVGGTGGSGGTGGAGASAGVGGSAGTSAAGGTSAGGTTGGSGGTTGASGGTTGAGGTGGMASAESDIPRCIADLIAPCTCQVAADGCGPRTCFVAGVTTTTTKLDGGTCGGPGDYEEKHFLKPDGSICYSTRTFWNPNSGGCEMVSLLWLDAAGNTVASGYGAPSFQPCGNQTPRVTCSATGETGTVPYSSSSLWPRTDCAASDCR